MFGIFGFGAPAALFRFIVAQIWPQHLVHDTNTILNLPQRRAFWLDTKKAASHGPIMNGCTENYWPRATRSRDSPLPTFTASACYAQKNPHCNATAGWLRNILHRNFPKLTLCICKKRPVGRVLFSGGVVRKNGILYDISANIQGKIVKST